MAAKFQDAKGREWSVVMTGETICEAAARGIDFSADFVRGVVSAIRATMNAPEPAGDDATPEEKAAAEEARRAYDADSGRALLDVGSMVVSLRLVGTLLELCWLGCRHNSRVQAEHVDEAGFKRALYGKSLRDACLAAFNAAAECFDLPLKLGETPDPTAAAAGAAKR